MKTKLYIPILVFACIFCEGIQAQLQLWYNKPAVKWTEALPIGNGRLGAMIFGGVNEERIQFNEETLWTGKPRDYNKKGAYKYLDSIRHLLFAGKQKEAEALAEEQFMGVKSGAGDKELWVKNIRSLKSIQGNPALPDYDDSKWQTMSVPSYDGWEAIGFSGLDGAVWLRKNFVLPNDWKGEDLVLDLNRIRDEDFTYVNGHLVGTMATNDSRRYTVAKNILHSGNNTISILVLNYFDKGGIQGYKDTARHISIYPPNVVQRTISLNGQWKYKIQNDEPPATPHYQADYQPFGDLWLHFRNVDSNSYRRTLDLNNAEVTTEFISNGIHYTRSFLASQPDQVIAIHLTADKKGSISFEAGLSSPHKHSSVRRVDASTIAISVAVTNGALKGESFLKLNAVNGKVSILNNQLVVDNADEVTMYLTAATNYKNYKDISNNPVAICKSIIEKISSQTFAQVRERHQKEYRQYFNTLSIDLGKTSNENLPTDQRIQKFASSQDPSLVALYLQYGRYLLISSSRPGTRPANLQGIWNDLLTPPWGSKYTTNINLEMNYWPAELLNLSALHRPLFTMIKELAASGSETAKEYYNAPGWVLHHNTDLWRGTAPINASNHGIWVSGGAWLCHHLWEHYLFTQDKIFLRDTAYPLMKSGALFFNSFLTKDPVTGYLISAPSNSPEQGGLVAGPTMDHEIIRDLFKNTIAASELLNTDLSLRNELGKKLTEIAPYKIGKYGQLQEWMQDIDDTTNKHRHVSHLWAVYPGSEINWYQTPDLLQAAKQSLIYRGDAATGWSLAWKINFWTRFKDGDHAFNLLRMLLSPAGRDAGSYPNLFDAHPPFQIDGNFGAAAGIGEMLLQSHTGYIDILPALPSALANGEVKGLCARGGFVIDISWKNGIPQQVSVLSLAGKDCTLRYKDKTVKLKTTKGSRYIFDADLRTVKLK